LVLLQNIQIYFFLFLYFHPVMGSKEEEFVNHPLRWRARRSTEPACGKECREPPAVALAFAGLWRARRKIPPFAASPSVSPRMRPFRKSIGRSSANRVSSGARRTLPPTGWLRASPCPPAKRVVKSTFTLKGRIFKPAVFNPFQTDADSRRPLTKQNRSLSIFQ